MVYVYGTKLLVTRTTLYNDEVCQLFPLFSNFVSQVNTGLESEWSWVSVASVYTMRVLQWVDFMLIAL